MCCEYDTTYILTKIAFHQTGTEQERENNHIYFNISAKNLNYLEIFLYDCELNILDANK